MGGVAIRILRTMQYLDAHLFSSPLLAACSFAASSPTRSLLSHSVVLFYSLISHHTILFQKNMSTEPVHFWACTLGSYTSDHQQLQSSRRYQGHSVVLSILIQKAIVSSQCFRDDNIVISANMDIIVLGDNMPSLQAYPRYYDEIQLLRKQTCHCPLSAACLSLSS